MRRYRSLSNALAAIDGYEGPWVLTQDDDSGCTTSLWSLRPGSVVDLAVPGYDAEYCLLSGRLDEPDAAWPVHAYRLVGMAGSLPVSVAEPSVLLRRTLPPHDTPTADSTAPADPARTAAVHRAIDPSTATWIDVPGHGGAPGLRRLPLRWEVERRDCSMLVRFEPGWASPHGRHHHSTFEEALVLTGAIETDEGVSGPGSYVCKPPGTPQSPPRSSRGATVWISHGGAMDFRPVA